MWSTKYIGIPYIDNGRDASGTDCWGLVRLVYEQEYGVTLPSFSTEYTVPDTSRIADLMCQYREGWNVLSTPKAGAAVIFNILGKPSHIGVMIDAHNFLHTRRGQAASIESIYSPKWAKRIVGYYEYTENSAYKFQELPVALTATKIDLEIPEGFTIGDAFTAVYQNEEIPEDRKSRILLFVNGKQVFATTDSSTLVHTGDTLEFRLVPEGDDTMRNVLTLAVVVFAATIVGPYAASLYTTAGTGVAASVAGGIGATGMAGAVGLVAQMATVAIGMALVNAIFPVRPPDALAVADPGTSNPQLMLTGSRNEARPYQTIPVVLGQYKYLPPLGATTYVSVENDLVYLRMLLVWGYGPLYIDPAEIRVGNKLLSSYDTGTTTDSVRSHHVYGSATETSTDLQGLYDIYGPDTYQVSPSLDLTYTAGDTESDWQSNVILTSVNNINVSLHFSQGLRGVLREGKEAGATIPAIFTGIVRIREVSQSSVPIGTGWLQTRELNFGGEGTAYYKRKDAFTYTEVFEGLPYGFYEVQVRRTNDTEGDLSGQASKPYLYHSASLFLITGTNASTKAAIPPNNASLAMTALKIQATDKLSGSIEGINALVKSICLDWDKTTSTWVSRPTRNPASLFRYILQHPANAHAFSAEDVDSRLDLAQLQYWHEYCELNSYTYDAVLVEPRGILEILKDIAAAGKASPVMKNGKWTVIVEEPRSLVVQHFTPHNSWGFEGTRVLVKVPDALRVNYVNSEKDYQLEEVLVYNTGFDSTNAVVFESIQLPGVTTYAAAYKHARFHLAQLQLRRETYVLNCDVEHLVCTRGDLVRVAHDVPMWGSGTGRIADYISSTQLKLDEPIIMQANTAYVIRIRTADGSSITRNLVNVATSDEYDTITLASSLTPTQGAHGNLFMIGTSNRESAELIVLTVEPSTNMTARLSLVDYAPEVYLDDSLPIPAYSTNITRPPVFARNYITSVPSITASEIRSDDSTMAVSGNTFTYSMVVPFSNPTDLNSIVTHVEARIDLAGDTSLSWRSSVQAPISSGSIQLTDVLVNETYSIQLRYLSASGYVGPWSEEVQHTIVGRYDPVPSPVTASVASKLFSVHVSWNFPDAREDIKTTEVWVSSTNNRGNAAKLNSLAFPTTMVVHSGLQPAAPNYYWIRTVSSSGKESAWFPTSAAAGMYAAATSDASEVLTLLEGELTSSALSTTLANRINLIDGGGTNTVLPGSLVSLVASQQAVNSNVATTINTLASDIVETLNTANASLELMADAGIYTEPGSGLVKIYGVEESLNRVSNVEVGLNAANSAINLRATTAYVNNAIAEATLSPADLLLYSGLDARVSSAEVSISGLNSSVSTKASNATVNAQGIRITDAETEIDALQGEITTKVASSQYSTEVGQLTNRVASAETTLSALGDVSSIVQEVSKTHQTLLKENADAETTLRAILSGDREITTRQIEIANARQELTASIQEGISAEAASRLSLVALVNSNQAALENNYYTKAGVDYSIASAKSSLYASNTSSRIFKQPTAPEQGNTVLNLEGGVVVNVPNIKANDVWIDSDNGNKMYVWDGTGWAVSPDADIAAVDARVTDVATAAIGYCLIGGQVTGHASSAACISAGGSWQGNRPLASAVKQLDVMGANGSTLSLEQAFIAQKDVNNVLTGQYTVKIDNNGYVSGFGLANTSANGTPSSEFIITADKFAIAPVTTDANANDGSPFFFIGATTNIGGTMVPPGVYMKSAIIHDASITSAKIASLAAGKLTAGSISVDTDITSTGFVQGSNGWRIRGDGTAEFAAAAIRGQLSAGQIDARGLSILDAAGNVVLAAGSATFNGNVAGSIAGTSVSTVVSTLNSNTTNISTLNSNVAGNTSSISTLNTNVANNTSSISGLNSSVAGINSALNTKLNTTGAATLVGPVSLNAATAILVGNTNDGLYLGNNGIVGRKAGATTFAVDASGNATFAGTLSGAGGSFAGAINTGSYTGYSWPASGGSGSHLSAAGLLVGNANDGKYFQVTATGDVYAPGFSIINGAATFTGTISARPLRIATGTILAGARFDVDASVYPIYSGLNPGVFLVNTGVQVPGWYNDNTKSYMAMASPGSTSGGISIGYHGSNWTYPNIKCTCRVFHQWYWWTSSVLMVEVTVHATNVDYGNEYMILGSGIQWGLYEVS